MAALQTFGPGTLGGLGTFGPGTFSGGTPTPRWMVPGWCGCCTCTYFLDRFTRADGSDLGSNWDQQLGTWVIADYRVETTSSNARLICNVVDDPDNDEHVVSAALRGMGLGDQPRLISSKLIGADTYWFFQMTYGATTVDLDLYQRTDGSDVQRGSTTTIYNMEPGIPLALRICFDGTTISAQYRRITDTIWTTATSYATTEITDALCGVGTGTVNNEVRVDDFRLEKHGTLYPGCPTCGTKADCYACEEAMPDEFLIIPQGDFPLLGPTCRLLLPENGYVVRRHTLDACLYVFPLDPPIPVVFGSVYAVNLRFVRGWFMPPFTNQPDWRAYILFRVFASWGYHSIWYKTEMSTDVCRDLSAEAGWSLFWNPWGCEYQAAGIDWEVTAL